MSEILFRGKRKLGNEWIEGSLHIEKFTDDEEYLCCEVCQCDVYPETVGQYTGLTDKNGKKIFEGDICKHRSNYSGDFVITTVTYTDGQFLAIVDKDSGFNLSDKLEIVGNIYDNPELLKGGEG